MASLFRIRDFIGGPYGYSELSQRLKASTGERAELSPNPRRNPFLASLSLLLLALPLVAQQPDVLPIPTKNLPKGSLWNRYTFRFQTSGGVEPYHWTLVAGTLPRNLELRDSGDLIGIPQQSGAFDFAIEARDSDRSPRIHRQKFALLVEAPLRVDWKQKAQINGQRIDGSVKVSNTTGRSLDLTYIVLAVNAIGRATAIGYQHFPLQPNTQDMELPFGETLSPGNYVVHVDVVGEEPISNMIFRARLATGQQSITQGP